MGIPGKYHELIQHPAVTDCEKQMSYQQTSGITVPSGSFSGRSP